LDNHYVAWRSALDHIAAKALWLRPGTKESMAQLAESLPSFLIRGKYKFTYDCFSPRILQWRNSLAHFVAAPDLRFLEIGSFEGHSACWLLDNILTHSSSHLVCIDTFKSERAESHFDMNISLTGASHRVTKRIGPSEDELVKLEKNSFDFIYVDGSHEQVSVLQDEVLAWRLLKIGGIMILDDYEMSKDPVAKFLYSNEHPDVGIDAFLDVFKDKYNLIHKGYQVIIQKL
jgi:predicted O-methyltransferase YrrM